MLYRISHSTTYEYAEPVSLCQNLAHLTPRNSASQDCRHSALAITPLPSVLTDRIDYFGNATTFFAVQEPHRQLNATANHLVEVSPPTIPELSQSPAWEDVRELLQKDLSAETLLASEFVCDSRYVRSSPDLVDYARSSFSPGRPILEAVRDLTHRIFTDFQYDQTATTVATTLFEVFANRRGVCQDFAHLQIACLRSLGLAARYMSGYLSTEPPPGCVPLVGTDATHAWLSIYSPRAGWIDVDPTNDQFAGDRHILLAWGRDYDDVSPIKGIVLGGGAHTVSVGVEVVSIPDADQPAGAT
jgi:transglutaminase-like putative cysteine protease